MKNLSLRLIPRHYPSLFNVAVILFAPIIHIDEMCEISVVDELAEPNLVTSILPNPTHTGNINVQLQADDVDTPIRLHLVNSMGHIVAENEIIAGQVEGSMLLTPDETLQRGFYLLQIQQGNEWRQHRIYIEE